MIRALVSLGLLAILAWLAIPAMSATTLSAGGITRLLHDSGFRVGTIYAGYRLNSVSVSVRGDHIVDVRLNVSRVQ